MPRKLFGHNDWRADAVAAVGEFLGTFTFLLFGLGGIQAARTASVISGTSGETVQVTVPSVEFLLMAATSMGLALTFSIWIFFRVTGAAFNPNIVSGEARRLDAQKLKCFHRPSCSCF